jgi:uncharacterized membrane protein YeaQ/YmgE (transglycosylase-associated protein family)
MNLLAWLVFGLIAGAIAKLVVPGRDPGGWIVTILLGIVGAFVGGWIGARAWGSEGITGFDLHSFGLAVLGAGVLLVLYRIFFPSRRAAAARKDRRAA